MATLTGLGDDSDRSHDEPFNDLANQLVERMRGGESLSVERLVEEYPERASEICELFPLLQLMEGFRQPQGTASSGAADTGDDPCSPWQLGEYRILRRIGQGGMGVVYEALHDSLGRNVALKVLSLGNARNKTLMERFKREARAAALLHHSNIVPVFAIGESEGLLYYAMQLIQGLSLDRVFSDQWPTYGVAIAKAVSSGGDRYHLIAHIGAQVADALAHAHAHGVLHRDIKPGNILVEPQGDAWVTDFGLAQMAGLSDLTASGDVIGTLRYVPPENFTSHGDARGDVYSLGLTLYELLTQTSPFGTVSRAELIHRILHMPLASARSVDPRIPKDLDTIVAKASARESEHRYQSAQALSHDLRLFCAGEPILARRLSLVERGWHWWKKNRLVSGAVISTVALLLTISAILTQSYLSESRSREKLENTLLRVVDAEGQVRQALLHSYLATAEAAQRSHQQGQRLNSLKALHQAEQLLADIEPKPVDADLLRSQIRDLAISSLTLPDIRELSVLEVGQIDLFHLDRCAQLDAERTLHVYHWPSQIEISQLNDVNENTFFSFTPNRDEMLLVDQVAGSVDRWQIDQSQSTRVADIHENIGPIRFCEFSRDGRRMLLSVDRGDLSGSATVLDWPTGRNYRKWEILYVGEIDPATFFSPDGQSLAVIEGPYRSEGSHRVRVIDVDTQKELALLTHSASVRSVTWYPDSRTLAAGLTDSNDIIIWDTHLQKQIATLNDQRGGGPRVCANSKELLVSSSTWSNKLNLWHAQTFKSIMEMPTDYIFAWSLNDGRLLGDRRAPKGGWQCAVLEPSPVVTTLVRNPLNGPVVAWRDLSVHRDGRLLAVGSNQGVFLFDLMTGQQIGCLHVGYALHPWFVPDSGELLTYSEVGLLRWQIQFKEASSTETDPRGEPALHATIGPPKKLPCIAAFGTRVSSDNSGQVIAVAAGASAFIFHNDGERIIELNSAPDCRLIAVSPDGRWVASGPHIAGFIDLWRADTGEKFLPSDTRRAGVLQNFSPDSQTLALADRFIKVDESSSSGEQEMVEIQDGFNTCFSPDGRLFVSLHTNGANVCEFPSGRKIGSLTTPDRIRYADVRMTPNGQQVLCSSNDRGTIDVWDLRKLNRELSAMNLGWDGFDAQIDEAPEMIPTMTIECLYGDLKQKLKE